MTWVVPSKVLKAAMAAGIVALMLVGVQSLAAEEGSIAGESRTIQVQGEATIKASPDQAQITFGVETEGSTSAEALNRNSELMNKVIAALKQAGIQDKDIQTQNVSVYPNYRHSGPVDQEGVPAISGYLASNQVSVLTNRLDQISSLIDKAVQAGANQMHGISFSVANTEAVYHQALEEALDVARGRAERLSRAADARLGKILAIDASGGDSVVIPYAGGRAARDMATPIEPGQVETRAQVRVVWELMD